MAQLESLRFVTKLASESGSMTATILTDGYSKSISDEHIKTKEREYHTLDNCYDLVDVVVVVCNAVIGDCELSV